MGENSERNETVDNLLGNIPQEVQNVDHQYVPLSYTLPQVPVASNQLNWNQTDYVNHFPSDPPVNNFNIDQYNPTFGYVQDAENVFSPSYNKNLKGYSEMNYYMKNGSPHIDSYHQDYRFICQNFGQHLLPNVSTHQIQQPQSQQGPFTPSNGPNHLIDNLVGNWVVPNTSGTYSPFGNTDAIKTNVSSVLELSKERENINNDILGQKQNETKHHFSEEKHFAFNRDLKKPRIIAEVKPMRPSYSDVLTKPVTQPTSTKQIKVDVKESKPKKENNKKTNRSEKQKINNSTSRNSLNDIKDVPIEKSNIFIKNNEKSVKTEKSNQLNRKWASLDNIAEPLHNKTEEIKKKKSEDPNSSKTFSKLTTKKINKHNSVPDSDTSFNKSESFTATKNGIKKGNKFVNKQRNGDSSFSNNERPPGKRFQRVRKRENHFLGAYGQKIKQYMKEWWKIFTIAVLWFINLISDIFSLSAHLTSDLASNIWTCLYTYSTSLLELSVVIVKRMRIFTWFYEKFKKDKEPEEKQFPFNTDLQHNINMPTTGEEAMKRLLACKGKDPYSILGVTPTCTDDDIKKYYKRQAFLVHPDKNPQPGAEEAFKILVHAFDMIGEPERRASYDRGVAESAQAEYAWTELTELLAQLQQKVEAAANTIRCSSCGLRHKRIKTSRPSYAARNCISCKIHHAAREGDIWAEARCFGFLWHYYACMEGAVYDITEWAGCQKDCLKHLRPDSHHIQYRIALGKQNNQPRNRHSSSMRTENPPDLENLLNTLYGQVDGQGKRRSKKTK